jgi:hypothetical protein
MQKNSNFIFWLRNAGVPVPRPGVLLLALAALLASTLAYLGIVLWDNPLVQYADQYMPELTPAGKQMVARGSNQQAIFLAFLLLGAQFCLAKGWRFSRRIWLLVLFFVALANLPMIVLAAIPLIVNLLVDAAASEVPQDRSFFLIGHLVVSVSFLVASILLFMPAVRRWRAALREQAAEPV